MNDIDLSSVWDFIVAQGCTVYVSLDHAGIDDGGRVVMLGGSHVLSVYEGTGYAVADLDDYNLVAKGDYDEDAALRAASDLTGILAVVGIPGGGYHAWRWFDEGEDEAADDWLQAEFTRYAELNPAKRIIETRKLSGGEAFDVKFRDGNRPYFDENVYGGFRHRVQPGDFDF